MGSLSRLGQQDDGGTLLNRIGSAARTAREAISPWNLLSPTDVASFAPGGGLAQAWQDSGRARDNLKAGNYGRAVADYGSMALNTLGEVLPLSKMAIVPIAAAAKTGVPVKLPNDDVFRQAVANTKGASITDDGLVMSVMRQQQPAQAGMESTRGGVFYLPEGSPNAKHYRNPTNYYGGPETISGETAVRNPMFVKGATGGKAPETAYDQLVGKGAYQNMRSEAMSAINAYMLPRAQKVELVERFLEKHAPELAGYGEYIMSNSAKGNQLAYALQEAAVGSAVRKAGNDGVVGYSKGKSGPFLSELFDVRESHYPDKAGNYTLWPQFEP